MTFLLLSVTSGLQFAVFIFSWAVHYFFFFFLSDSFILFFRTNKGLILPLDLKFRISAENKATNYKFNIWNELQIFYLLRL